VQSNESICIEFHFGTGKHLSTLITAKAINASHFLSSIFRDELIPQAVTDVEAEGCSVGMKSYSYSVKTS